MPFKLDKQIGDVWISANNGETFEKLGRINDVDITSELEECDDSIICSEIIKDYSTTFTCDIPVHFTTNTFLRAIMNNNWLKMHKIPMRRRK